MVRITEDFAGCASAGDAPSMTTVFAATPQLVFHTLPRISNVAVADLLQVIGSLMMSQGHGPAGARAVSDDASPPRQHRLGCDRTGAPSISSVQGS